MPRLSLRRPTRWSSCRVCHIVGLMLVGAPASGKSKGGAPRKPWEQLSARAKRDRRQKEARDANRPVAVAVTAVPADEHGAAGTNAAHEVSGSVGRGVRTRPSKSALCIGASTATA